MGAMSSADLDVIKDYSGRDYRTVWHGPRAAFEDRFEGKLIEEMLPGAGGWFVDVGAGYGRLYPLYAAEGRKLVLVDYAVSLLEEAARTIGAGNGVEFVAANAYRLPFRPGSFDGGISIRTFHHMASPQRFLDEFGRVLRGGSHALLEYSNKRNVPRILRHGRRSLRKDHEDYGDLLFGVHPAYFEELAASAGLTVEETRGTGFLSRIVTERTRSAVPLFAAAESGLDAVLGRGLAPVEFVRLRAGARPAADPEPAAGLVDLLRCPACGGAVRDAADGMRCESCRRQYPRVGAVLDFRYLGSDETPP
jgi:SAM-dependent methyltransferase